MARRYDQECEDIRDFYKKLQIPYPSHVRAVSLEMGLERARLMMEEVLEFMEAVSNNDLEKQADALVDLIYYAKGTAVLMGLPWRELWDEVQRANMDKEAKATSRSSYDAVKPVDWVPPRINEILKKYFEVSP